MKAKQLACSANMSNITTIPRKDNTKFGGKVFAMLPFSVNSLFEFTFPAPLLGVRVFGVLLCLQTGGIGGSCWGACKPHTVAEPRPFFHTPGSLHLVGHFTGIGDGVRNY